MVRFLLSFTALSIIACAPKPEECPTVFFGGAIVNPTSDAVVLCRNNSTVDSVQLDEQHRFSFTLKGIEEGLYHFNHSPELQYVYLQEGDSMLIRLNTMAFDESLVFSGKGSEINNFLIEMFLTYEQEAPLLDQYYALNPDAFSVKMDSLHSAKTAYLHELTASHALSAKAVAMAKAAIDYPVFMYKEKYPFYHKKKTGREIICDLPPTFYSHRNTVDLNNRELTYFKPYFDFMKYHLGNLAYTTCKENCEGAKKPASDPLHFSTDKIQLIDRLVQEEELKNLLLRNVAMNYLLKEHKSSKACQAFIEKFYSLSTHKKHKEEITHLYQGIQNLQPSNHLPNLVLTDINNKAVSLKEISKNNTTVFYFWTGDQESHLKSLVRRVKKLKEEYPAHKFVGINFRTDQLQWIRMVEEYNLDKGNQFYGENFSELQTTMIIDGLNKCVIAKDMVVVDGFAHLYTSFPAIADE